jgi:hypothetical protein
LDPVQLSEYVEVCELTFRSVNKDVVASYLIREHEGDTVTPSPGLYTIRKTPKDVLLPNGQTMRVKGEEHIVSGQHVFEITRTYRYEPRVRPMPSDFMKGDRVEAAMLRRRFLDKGE